MSEILLELPTPGGDDNIWATKLNVAVLRLRDEMTTGRLSPGALAGQIELLAGPIAESATVDYLAANPISWSTLAGKPSTFTPAAHSQGIATITGLQAALDAKQASGSYAPAGHTHEVSSVTGLQGALDAKAGTTHTHAISNITGLQTALDDKATAGHVHAIGAITGLEVTLSGKAATLHTHTISNTTGLQAALDAKAGTGHDHDTRYVRTVNGVGPNPSGDVAVGIGASAWGDITDKPAEITNLSLILDGKVAKGEVEVSVKDHGVVGDGTADDSAAIQAVFDSADGPIYFPPGIYRTTTTLVFPAGKSVRFAPGQAHIYYYGSGEAFAIAHGTNNHVIENIRLYRMGTTKAGTTGIRFRGNQYVKIHNPMVRDFEVGIDVHGDSIWSASNDVYSPLCINNTIGIRVTADVNKQSNHLNVFGGYVFGHATREAGGIGVHVVRGDTNCFYGTAVEEYEVGYRFSSLSQGANAAVKPRTEACTTHIIIDSGVNAAIWEPNNDVTDNSNGGASIYTKLPVLAGDRITWSAKAAAGDGGIRFRDSGGLQRTVFWQDLSNNVHVRAPIFGGGYRISLQVPDGVAAWQEELVAAANRVEIRRYLRLGIIGALPTADVSQRGRMVRTEGAAGVADGLHVCMKKADDTYEWRAL